MYTRHAHDYDRAISDNIYNAHLERPSMLSMLPDLRGKRILDLGCGPGAYVEHLLKADATVTAVDRSTEMIGIINEKFGDSVTAYTADISQGLPLEEDNSFDLVICPLTVHYIEDVLPLFREVNRVLKPDGGFYFSTHHPLVDFEVSPSGNYFMCEVITEEWDTTGHPVTVSFYRRSLTEWFDVISAANLHVTRLFEGQPSAEMESIEPEAFRRLSRNPNFIFFACKPNGRDRNCRIGDVAGEQAQSAQSPR